MKQSKTTQCIAYLQSILTSDHSMMEQLVMMPFYSNAFILGIINNASSCMDTGKKYFSGFEQTKGVTLIKGVAVSIEVNVYSMVH